MIRLKTLLLCVFVAGAFVSPAPPTALPQEVLTLFNDSRSNSFRATGTIDLRRFEELFADILAPNPDLELLRSQFAELGFELRSVDDRWLVIVEHQDRKHGRGFFVFNRRPQAQLFVQAPHRVDDRSSGQLALDLLAAGASVAGISTVPRDLVDLAHTDRCEFSAATAAFATKRPQASVLQLHGYTASSHPDLDNFDGVLSNSTRKPTPALDRIRTCFRKDLEMRIACYPLETSELGGTTNSQARVAHRHGLPFHHLELDEQTRVRLREKESLIPSMFNCFVGGTP